MQALYWGSCAAAGGGRVLRGTLRPKDRQARLAKVDAVPFCHNGSFVTIWQPFNFR